MDLRQDFQGDAALVITELQLSDIARYRCEVVDGLEDKSTRVNLELQGTVQRRRNTSSIAFILSG